ncbi:MAG: hypothetical protein HC888_02620 [Candidatus Competibacteraceae bacterium]|nr:hypothetical protein [Candidatus Competibacteraceae bacterium]
MTAAEKKKAQSQREIAVAPENLPSELGRLMAEAKILAYSKMVPASYAGNPEAVFAIIQYGKELGIGAMLALQNIAFINGRPSLGSELRSAIAHKHPEYAGMKILEATEKVARVVVYRKFKLTGEVIPFEGKFTIEDAQRAGLLGRGTDSAWE